MASSFTIQPSALGVTLDKSDLFLSLPQTVKDRGKKNVHEPTVLTSSPHKYALDMAKYSKQKGITRGAQKKQQSTQSIGS